MTFVVDKRQLENVREIAFVENLYVKDILSSALEKYISEYWEKQRRSHYLLSMNEIIDEFILDYVRSGLKRKTNK